MSGTFSGEVVTLFLDRQIVQSWLPSGLHVADDCPFERHPVVILYGTQTNLARQKWIKRELPFGRHYLETFVAVPYLRVDRTRYDEHVFYFARVYLDNRRATNQGVRRFGWEKVYTALADQGRHHRIWSPGGRLIFAASGLGGPSRPADPATESCRMLVSWFDQTLVLKHEGRFDRYNFDLHCESASIRAVDTKLTIGRDFMPGTERMEGEVQGIDRQEFGTFHLSCHFTKAPK